MLGCIKTGVASREREGIVPLCSAPGGPHLQYCVQAWGCEHRKDVELLEWVQRGTEMLRGPLRWSEGWSTSYGGRWRELGLFSLEKRRLRGDLIAALQYLKGAYKQEGGWLLMWVDSDRTRGSGLKLRQGRVRLDIGKFFPQRW